MGQIHFVRHNCELFYENLSSPKEIKTLIEVGLEMEAVERSAYGHDCRKGELLHGQQCTFLV